MQLLNRAAPALAALAIAALGLAPRAAQALDFTFTFTTASSSTGGAGQTVGGTLSGLVDGNNAGPGITAVVTQSPDPTLDGTYTFSNNNQPGDSFTVSGGNITYASAYFQMSPSEFLFFGSDPASRSTYAPELIDTISGNYYANGTMPDNFAPAAAVPEPSTVAPFALAGLGLLGLSLRARRRGNIS